MGHLTHLLRPDIGAFAHHLRSVVEHIQRGHSLGLFIASLAFLRVSAHGVLEGPHHVAHVFRLEVGALSEKIEGLFRRHLAQLGILHRLGHILPHGSQFAGSDVLTLFEHLQSFGIFVGGIDNGSALLVGGHEVSDLEIASFGHQPGDGVHGSFVAEKGSQFSYRGVGLRFGDGVQGGASTKRLLLLRLKVGKSGAGREPFAGFSFGSDSKRVLGNELLRCCWSHGFRHDFRCQSGSLRRARYKVYSHR